MHATILALLLIQIPQIALPTGNDVWVVQVVTTGGLRGTGIGNFAISSEGKVLCSTDLKCPDTFKGSDIQALVAPVFTASLPTPAPAGVSLCRDCITRIMRITWRDSMGVSHTYAVSWDETTTSSLPTDIVRIYDAVLALRQ